MVNLTGEIITFFVSSGTVRIGQIRPLLFEVKALGKIPKPWLQIVFDFLPFSLRRKCVFTALFAVGKFISCKQVLMLLIIKEPRQLVHIIISCKVTERNINGSKSILAKHLCISTL